MRIAVAGVLASLAFVVDPACYLGEHYDFGESDMKAAIEGHWQLTADGKTYAVDIAQQRGEAVERPHRGWLTEAHACGRSFIQSASACIVTSEMPIVATSPGGTLHGMMYVEGEQFVRAEIVLAGEIGGAQVSADALVSPAGKLLPSKSPTKLVRL